MFILDPGSGSGFFPPSRIRIPDPGKKKHPILDPGPRHWLLRYWFWKMRYETLLTISFSSQCPSLIVCNETDCTKLTCRRLFSVWLPWSMAPSASIVRVKTPLLDLWICSLKEFSVYRIIKCRYLIGESKNLTLIFWMRGIQKNCLKTCGACAEITDLVPYYRSSKNIHRMVPQSL